MPESSYVDTPVNNFSWTQLSIHHHGTKHMSETVLDPPDQPMHQQYHHWNNQVILIEVIS